MSRAGVIAVVLLLSVSLYYGFQDLRSRAGDTPFATSPLTNPNAVTRNGTIASDHTANTAPRSPSTAVNQAQTIQPRSPATATTLPPTTTTLPTTALMQKQTEIQDLQVQLLQERQELQNQTEILRDLQSQKTELQKQTAETQMDQASTYTLEIQDLTDQLQNLRLNERDILQATDLALRDQSYQLQIEREIIDQNIQALQNGIQQTQEQIRFWSESTYSFTDRQTQLATLQAELDQQQQALNELRLQRLNIAANVLAQRRNLQTQALQEKADMITNQNDIQSRISELRAELRQLQVNRSRRQLSSPSLDEQIQQTQTSLNEQTESVQNLEGQLREKEEELQSLQ